MTTTPEPPPVHDDESGSADDRFDRRIAFGVVAALAVVGTVGPFGWHLLSNGSGASTAAGAAIAAVNGGAGGAGGIGSAVVNPAAGTSTASHSSSHSPSPSSSSSPSSSPNSGSSPSSGSSPASSPSSSANPTTSGSSAAARASASCGAAFGNAKPVTGASGTMSSLSDWASMATPSVNTLRANAASLHGIVVRQDAAAVPAAAKSLCDGVGSVGRLAAMPDTAGATAWQAALSAYVAGATDALAAADHPAYYQAARVQLAQGEQELDALSARITAATRH